jgi:hypothetical protein
VAVARWHGEEVALEISASTGGGGLIETKRERTKSKRMVKRVRSAFRVMTGRGGRMTGRGGGSIRSRSSKLLE